MCSGYAKGFSALVHLKVLFCPYTFAKVFPAYIYLQKVFFCLSTILWGFSAFTILQIAFLPMYICKQFFCLYIFEQLLQMAFLPLYICKRLFCLSVFAKGFSAHICLQRAFLPIVKCFVSSLRFRLLLQQFGRMLVKWVPIINSVAHCVS